MESATSKDQKAETDWQEALALALTLGLPRTFNLEALIDRVGQPSQIQANRGTPQ